MELPEAIARELAQWGTPVVEPLVFGTVDAHAIASMLERLCIKRLGAGIADCGFYRSSVGCVAALELVDGQHVVVKVHQPERSAGRLRACQAVQTALADLRYPCPRPLLGPTPICDGRGGLATAETHLDRGARRDGHEVATRRLIAANLQRLVTLADPAHLSSGLSASWFTALGTRLWPRPHNALFDFEATAAGAEWIDDLARRARAVQLAGTPVVGHFDWRAEHLLFEDDELTAVHDWDSLHVELEPVVVGCAAHAFTAQHDQRSIPTAPTAAGLAAFFDDYEAARGASFSAAERATARAACVFALGYSARCEHSLPASLPRPFSMLLREAGEALLATWPSRPSTRGQQS